MKTGKWLIGSLVLAAIIGLAIGGWYVWRQHATPEPPAIPFTNMEAPMVEVIQKALDEVRHDPRSAEAWGDLAMTLSANGFHDQALECYEHAERFDPNNPSWLYLRGLNLLITGHPREALPLFQKALALTKDSEHRSAIHFRLGLILLEDGQLELAEQQFQEMTKIDPNDPRVHYGLGVLAYNRGDQKTAREHLLKLTQVPFARRHSYSLLASLSSSDPEQARKYTEEVARLNSDRPWPDPFEAAMREFKVDRMSRIANFNTLRDQGKLREAIRSLQRFVDQSPDAEVCTILAFAYFDDGQIERAEKMFRESIRYETRYGRAHMFLGICLYLEGEKLLDEPDGKDKARPLFEEAVAEEEKALALQGDLGRAHSTRGQALHHLGRDEEALNSLRQSIIAEPDVGEAHFFLGEALAEMGQLPEALEQLKYAVELTPPADDRPRKALEKWQKKSKETSQ
jgi:tetratricopeptide (TPR) repeat protein